jgi:protein-L-isoaspartate(D-aspartate) O-methyltransferase
MPDAFDPDSESERSSSQNAWSAAQRRRMVEEQLRRQGIDDPRVLEAMARVPREEFVPASLREAAYEDSPLPIGSGQTISQPFTVAFMCQSLRLRGGEKVLEVGTGSGYGAAVLSLLAPSVYTVERLPSLAASARERLDRLGFRNVEVVEGDGTLGLPGAAPFDAIVVTAGAEALPLPYLEQLAEGGRLVIPLAGGYLGQTLYCLTRKPGTLTIENLGGFVFVPLVGRFGYEEPEPRREPW